MSFCIVSYDWSIVLFASLHQMFIFSATENMIETKAGLCALNGICLYATTPSILTTIFFRWKLDTLILHPCVHRQTSSWCVTMFLMESKIRNWMQPAFPPQKARERIHTLSTRLDFPLGGISSESSKMFWRKHCLRMTLYALIRIKPDQGSSY